MLGGDAARQCRQALQEPYDAEQCREVRRRGERPAHLSWGLASWGRKDSPNRPHLKVQNSVRALALLFSTGASCASGPCDVEPGVTIHLY